VNLSYYATALKEANRELTKAVTRAQRVEGENRRLRYELAKTRRQVGRAGRLWILRRARADALTLLLWGFAGDSISRRAAIERGFSQRRWQWAKALLTYAQVVEDGEIVVGSIGEGAGYLGEAVFDLEAQDPRLDRLVALLPKGAVMVTNGTATTEPSRENQGRGDGLQRGRGA